MIKCEIDQKEFTTKSKLCYYLVREYNLTYKQYYHKYIIKSDDIPNCECGCGGKVLWHPSGKYSKFIRYHHIRVKNPWGHNPEARKKSAATRKRKFASGELKMWCHGMKKEDHPSLISAAQKLSSRYTPEIRKEYSSRMSKMRKDGTMPTLYGQDSSQWKGGTSSIQQITRGSKRLYTDWKYPILCRDGFKCTKCQKTTDLHVHHDGEQFSDIIKKVMTIDDYEKIDSFDVKNSVSEKIIDYHVNNKISGVTLCLGCHNELHPHLNF